MKNIEYLTSRMKMVFMQRILDIQYMPVDEHVISITAEDLHEITAWLLSHSDCYHLSTITAIDNGNTIEMLYHFWQEQGMSLKVELNRENAKIESLTDLIPGASFYEREIHEMFGVDFSGLQYDRPLLLADNWDGKTFPMRVNPAPLPEKQDEEKP